MSRVVTQGRDLQPDESLQPPALPLPVLLRSRLHEADGESRQRAGFEVYLVQRAWIRRTGRSQP